MASTEVLSLDQAAFMVTYTGTRFNIIAPKANQVDIIDIAHSLSQLCRFTGHTACFYSVAQHSCLAADYVEGPAALKLHALLHDASEAYINDLSRPLKHHPQMGAYTIIEVRLMQAIAERFGIPAGMDPRIKDIDNKLVCEEAIHLMKDHGWADGHARLNIVQLDCWSPHRAEREFLQRFYRLTGAI